MVSHWLPMATRCHISQCEQKNLQVFIKYVGIRLKVDIGVKIQIYEIPYICTTTSLMQKIPIFYVQPL